MPCTNQVIENQEETRHVYQNETECYLNELFKLSDWIHSETNLEKSTKITQHA